MPALEDFSRAYPGIDIEVVLSIPFLDNPAHSAPQADVAVRHGDAAALGGTVLMHDVVLPVAAPALLQRLGWPGAAATPADLALAPLLRTTPFVLLAAFCFSRGSARLEAWLLAHPRWGPLIRDWRVRHAMPLRAKQLAWAMMAAGSAWAAWVLPLRWCWLPALVCLAVGLWMWRLPTSAPRRTP